METFFDLFGKATFVALGVWVAGLAIYVWIQGDWWGEDDDASDT